MKFLVFDFEFCSEKTFSDFCGENLKNHPLFIADLDTTILIGIVNTVIVTITLPMARDALTIVAHKLILFARWFQIARVSGTEEPTAGTSAVLAIFHQNRIWWEDAIIYKARALCFWDTMTFIMVA